MNVIFDKTLSRINLLKCPKANDVCSIKISVYRNHSFEMIAAVLNPFLNFSGFNAEFVYSDYDDSLNFIFHEADVQIIWVDINRYNKLKIEDFLKERVALLRSYTKSPIFIFYTGDDKLELTNIVYDCYAFHMDDAVSDLKNEAYDADKESFSGTRLSGKACLALARVIGLKYLPAVLMPSLKAIVVDLDNTLYSGILGEDGISELIPFNDLQKKLKELKKQGFFLCISSKNEEEDVKKLFNERKDFVLVWEDFDAVQINWDAKSENILKLAKILNIGTDSMLFIDDNPAEIQNVEASGLEVKTILAEDQDVSLQWLRYYPGLLKLKVFAEDKLRSADIEANLERIKLVKNLTPQEYFKKLAIKLVCSVDCKESVGRVAELLGKTNQFLLTYARYRENEIYNFIKDKNKCVLTMHMSDSLSDSGIIAILIVEKNSDDELVLCELTVSCRALGRNLENIMLLQMFDVSRRCLNSKSTIIIKYKKGERNGPAMRWLSELCRVTLNEEGEIKYLIPEHIDLTGILYEEIL